MSEKKRKPKFKVGQVVAYRVNQHVWYGRVVSMLRAQYSVFIRCENYQRQIECLYSKVRPLTKKERG